MDMAPDRDQLRSMSQKDKETFKEYAQRWRELAAQITPPLEEKEMIKIFLKIPSSFYYECMIASAPNDFTEMVNMGMRLEEGVREGQLSKEEVSSSKRYDSSFRKKKDSEANAITSGRQRRPHTRRNQPSCQHHHQVSSIILVFSASQSTPIQQQQHQQQQPQQRTNTYNNNNNTNNHQQQTFERKKPDLHCAFHQGAPGHDTENRYSLKYKVQKLVKNGMVSFEYRAPNVQANPLPVHVNSFVNMVDGCPREFKVFDVFFIRRSLMTMHKDICMVNDCEHDHDGCAICSVNPRGCMIVKRDIQWLMDEGMIQIVQSRHVDDDVNVIVPVFENPERVVIQYDNSNSNNISQRLVSSLVIRLAGPVPYSSDKAHCIVPFASSENQSRELGQTDQEISQPNKQVCFSRSQGPRVGPTCSHDLGIHLKCLGQRLKAQRSSFNAQSVRNPRKSNLVNCG
ncbi:hypothetical protein KIW84_074904 [Lathyrus oleraceus]|uniref:Retrotransposon gag domain-containing protein n=1 Tax=Pisum sativum TaxID=3888 RepID=A0A9D4VVB3_PEA|nr:hypothetical protein KIW84_074904 [Pisum sativum]